MAYPDEKYVTIRDVKIGFNSTVEAVRKR